MAYHFHRDTRVDLVREHLDEPTIAALENEAGQFHARRSRRKTLVRRPPRTQLRRSIKARAATFLRYLQRQDSFAIEFNLHKLIRELSDVALRRDGNEKGGRPRDEARYQLECGIGWVLHSHGVDVTNRRNGPLARILEIVLLDVGIKLEDPNTKRSCVRVCAYVHALADGLADLDRWLSQ